MKQKEKWAAGCIEGLKMKWCRPPSETEAWLSGFHYAKKKCSEEFSEGECGDSQFYKVYEDIGENDI